ncbi:MAG: hypothetical protein WDN47_03210 [Candidatus Doudnabacteria bacterium]
MKWFIIPVCILVLAIVVAAFFIVGSPARQRSLNFDNRRVSDLQIIQGQVLSYWQQKGSLPANLSNLTDNISGFTAPKDPQTSADYEYSVSSNLNFQLCASFSLPSEGDQNLRAVPMIYPGPDNWQHAAGHVCFDRTIDPQLYKSPAPIPQPVPLK